MTTTSSIRTGGFSLFVGAVLALSPLSPGKDAGLALDRTWALGHSIDLASYLFLLLGLPAVLASMSGRRELPSWVAGCGLIGYAAFTTRLALSVGSHLYEARVVPVLAARPEAALALRPEGALYSLFGSRSTNIVWVGVLTLGCLPFAVALWHAATTTRWAAALIALGLVLAVAIPPLGIVIFSLVLGWLGVRLVVHADVTVPIRHSRTADAPTVSGA